ncbi:MAG: sugar phosphate isomerase/epimerase family protein [Planctomycetota bacterium]|jgi:sugar phosphate isomerase/epimerase
MRLAFSSNAFRKHSIEETIAILGEIGYEGVELMADAPHAWPPETTPEKIASINAALDRHGMAVSNVNAFMMCAFRHPQSGREGSFHWPSWIDDESEARVAHTVASIDIAAAVGAGSVSTEPGGPLEGDREEACRLFAGGLRRAAQRAVERGVTLLVEPEPGLLIERADEYVDFMKRHVVFPGVGLNLDLGHFFCVGEDPAVVVRRRDVHPVHVHLEDIAADRVHRHLPPGDGAMDFEAIFAALRERAYDGWVTVELYPFQDDAAAVARRAFEFLRPFLA